MYVYISGWISKKVIGSYKPGVPSTPSPNFPVSSSYKNRNCQNIRTSLDSLDSRHPKKLPLACVVFNKGRKPELKLACFLKVRQRLTGRRLTKSRYSTNFHARFVRREKSLVKNSVIKKRDLSISCLLKESASILE